MPFIVIPQSTASGCILNFLLARAHFIHWNINFSLTTLVISSFFISPLAETTKTYNYNRRTQPKKIKKISIIFSYIFRLLNWIMRCLPVNKKRELECLMKMQKDELIRWEFELYVGKWNFN